MNPEVIACIACCAVAAVGGLAVLRFGTKAATLPKRETPKPEHLADKPATEEH